MSKVMHFDCDVSDKQRSELLELVRSINKNEARPLTKYVLRVTVFGIDSNPLREVCHQDVVEHLEYEKDPRKSSVTRKPLMLLHGMVCYVHYTVILCSYNM